MSRQSTKITYLIGGGLTCATARRCAVTGGFMLRDLCRDTIDKISSIKWIRKGKQTGPLLNNLLEAVEENTPNIEDLVDLLISSGYPQCVKMARKLSEYFGSILSEKCNSLIEQLSQNLAQVLLDLYEIDSFNENILGIITTNYDTLLEIAANKSGYAIDLGFDEQRSDRKSLTILKLHGSIDWKGFFPPQNRRISRECAEKLLWIGPSRSKSCDQYPFNLIWGKARSLLSKSDKICVIGASLLPSDWHLSQLLFHETGMGNRQSLNKPIEIVDFAEECTRIKNDNPLLPIVPIYEIDNVVRFFRLNKGVPWGDPISEENKKETRKYLEENKALSPVDYWLQARGSYLIYNEHSIDTRSNILRDFLSPRDGGQHEN